MFYNTYWQYKLLGKKGTSLWRPGSFTRENLIMNKNIFLVLVIIFIVLVVMGTGAYSWSQQNIERQKEERDKFLKT